MKPISRPTTYLACLLAMAFHLALSAPSEAQSTISDRLRQTIEGGIGAVLATGQEERLIPVFPLYEKREFAAIWVTENGATDKARAFLNILKNSKQDALDPTHYNVAAIEQRIGSADPKSLVALELMLTRALLDFGRDMNAGRVEPSKVNSDIHVFPKLPGRENLLTRVDQATDMSRFAASLSPQTPRYTRLKNMLKTYRQKAAAGGWVKLPVGPTLKPDMTDDRMPNLRKLVMQMGDLAGEGAQQSLAGEPNVYDPALVAAVKNFQYRHGIDQDGVIGPATLAEMQVPITTRIRQMEINLERRRWMQDELGSFYVFVNLADQFLKVVKQVGDREKTIHAARLVVGKPFHKTPVFSQAMTHLVLNPYWNVPPSIARKELLPLLKRNPGALLRQNIRILKGWGDNAPEIDPYSIDWQNTPTRGFPYRLRQDSGRRNALGKVKFLFPNRFHVYIHDTPSKSLFARSRRYFSHGCMRVQNPLDLAEILLRERSEGWNRRRIDQALATGRKRVVNIKSPITVHVTYLTAWVNKDLSVHFRKDVYGRDKLLELAIRRSGRSNAL